MSENINVSALVTRSVLLQSATAALDAAKQEECELANQINALQTKHFNAIAKRQQAENKITEITSMPETVLPVDVYRKVSLIEQEALPERTRVKGVAFDHLFANQDATFETIVGIMDSEGGSDRLHNYSGVVRRYIKNAFQAGMIQEESWEAFRAFVLFIGKDKALGL